MFEQYHIDGDDGAAEFNQAVADLEKVEANRQASADSALDDLAQKSAKDLRRIRDRLADSRLEIAQQALALACEGPAHCQAIAEDLEALRPKLEENLEKARKKTAAALKKTGMGPTDDPRYNDNPAAIEQQFRFKVDQAAPVREALEALHLNRTAIDLARKKKRDFETFEAQARAELEQAARAILGLRTPSVKRAPAPRTRRADPLIV